MAYPQLQSTNLIRRGNQEQVSTVQEDDNTYVQQMQDTLGEIAEEIQAIDSIEYTDFNDEANAVQLAKTLAVKTLRKALQPIYKYRDEKFKDRQIDWTETSIVLLIDSIQNNAWTTSAILEMYEDARKGLVREYKRLGFHLRPKNKEVWEKQFFRAPAAISR